MAQTNPTIDVANLIETQKANWFRISIIGLACAIMAFEGYDMQVLAYAAPSIIKAWHVNKGTFGQVIGLGLFGLPDELSKCATHSIFVPAGRCSGFSSR